MIHAMYETIASRQAQSAFFEVMVVYIDETSISTTPEIERQKNKDKIKEIVQSYQFPLQIIPLEAIYSLDTNLQGLVNEQDDLNKNKLKTLFESIESESSREDLKYHLRSVLLASVAKNTGLSTILLGCSATRLASNLISWTCKGRGFSLPEQLAILDKKFQSVTFLKPMRDFVSKEIAIYNYFKRLEILDNPLPTRLNWKNSIDRLSENFVENLQASFPHTTHTLLRSGNKLSHPPTEELYCSLCFSLLPKLKIDTIVEEKKVCLCNCEGPCEKNQIKLSDHVCYGCRKILQDCKKDELFPNFVGKTAEKLATNLKTKRQSEGISFR